MHYQAKPHEEAKLVRCTHGAIYDAIVDLRPDSPTYRRWVAVELTAEDRRMFYIPEGFAHGFIVLSESAEVLYKTTNLYAPKAERCVRWNDPALGIAWPLDKLKGEPILSEKDAIGDLLANADLPPVEAHATRS